MYSSRCAIAGRSATGEDRPNRPSQPAIQHFVRRFANKRQRFVGWRHHETQARRRLIEAHRCILANEWREAAVVAQLQKPCIGWLVIGVEIGHVSPRISARQIIHIHEDVGRRAEREAKIGHIDLWAEADGQMHIGEAGLRRADPRVDEPTDFRVGESAQKAFGTS